MFETSLVASTGILRQQNRWPAVASVLAQAAVAAAIITLPLLQPARLVQHSLAMDLTPPKLPAPPAPRPPMPRVHLTNTPALSTPTAPVENISPTPRISHPATTTSDEPAPTLNLLMPGGVATNSPLPIGTGTATEGRPNVSVAPSTGHTKTGPTAISTGVSAGLLLTPIQPLYPAIARAAHQQGTVEVEAIISRTGRVESVHATSGPAMLRPAAEDAVRTARYRPFLLNGQPTEVSATFSIHFTLNN